MSRRTYSFPDYTRPLVNSQPVFFVVPPDEAPAFHATYAGETVPSHLSQLLAGLFGLPCEMLVEQTPASVTNAVTITMTVWVARAPACGRPLDRNQSTAFSEKRADDCLRTLDSIDKDKDHG